MEAVGVELTDKLPTDGSHGEVVGDGDDDEALGIAGQGFEVTIAAVVKQGTHDQFAG